MLPVLLSYLRFYFLTAIFIFRLQPFFATTYIVQPPSSPAVTFPPAVTAATLSSLLKSRNSFVWTAESCFFRLDKDTIFLYNIIHVI